VAGGRVLWPARHARRLRRDAAALGLPAPAREACERALAESAAAAFGAGDGIVRLEWRGVRLVARPRPLGEERETWRALLATTVHPGRAVTAGVKGTDWPHVERAREEARAAGVDEAILLDAGGRVVEGARSNLVIVLAGGEAVTPPLARGAVAGLGRELALEAAPRVREADLGIADLLAAREVVATNAVRGARAVVVIDGARVGDGRAGPLARRLAELLANAE
jgi:branched-subunit amino acid aminotransferase/4-amino-4-deoxychorismate lyase